MTLGSPHPVWVNPGTTGSGQLLYIHRSNKDTHDYWDSVKTEEPVSDRLKELVKLDLKLSWYFWRDFDFRFAWKRRWMLCDNVKLDQRDSFPNFEWPIHCLRVCNKPTAFYWLQSAQRIGGNGERALTSPIIFAAIFDEWLRCYNYTPNIEWDHFFANPVRITATGPSTVREVTKAHLSLCTQVSGLLQSIQQTDSSAQHHSISHLYRAVVVIIDQLYDYEKEDDGFTSLSKLAQCQTVLIACTGVEEGLSAPISLESLKSDALPLEPSDVTHNADVVRVSLATAVRFIVSLEKRENPEILKIPSGHDVDIRLCRDAPKGFEKNDEVRRSAEAWADANMRAAEQHGFDNVSDTHTSIRRVQAGLVGEGYCEFIQEPFHRKWKP